MVSAASIVALVGWSALDREVVPEPSIQSARKVSNKIPAVMAKKLAATARFAPAIATLALDDPESFAEQDWLEHNTDGAGNGPTSFASIARSRSDWKAMRRRRSGVKGPWEPLGP